MAINKQPTLVVFKLLLLLVGFLALSATLFPVHAFVAQTQLTVRSLAASARSIRGQTGLTSLLFAKKKKKKKSPGGNTITVNRIAYRNYEVLDTLEAGICLTGTEVKAIRDGKMNIRDGYVRPSKDGRSCVLYNAHIGKHNTAGAYFQHEEKRARTLLVHKEQARKWKAQTDQDGMTIVPLKAYFSDTNLVKIQIALCRGKNVRDKRAAIKERDAKREANRIIKTFRL